MKFTEWEDTFLKQTLYEELRYADELDNAEHLSNLKALIIKLGIGRECPLCGEMYPNYPALSRVDNHTDICPNCGIREAMRPQTVDSFRELWNEAKSMPSSIEKALDERERIELAR